MQCIRPCLHSLRVAVSHRSKSTSINSDSQYCLEQLRSSDFDNFLCVCLYPPAYRHAAIAIHTFNLEIAQIRDVISDRKTGKMRMQFWLDAVNNIYKGAPPHTPIAAELDRAVRRHNLTKEHFLSIIEARSELLNDFPFKDLAHLAQYCDNTTGAILKLLLQSAGVQETTTAHTAAHHIGQAHGIVTLLRAIPYNVSRNRCYLPLDVMREHKVSPGLVGKWTGKDDDRVQQLIYHLADIARDNLNSAKSLYPQIRQKVLPLSFSMLLCDHYLSRLATQNYHVFSPTLQRRDNLLPMKLWIRSFKRTL